MLDWKLGPDPTEMAALHDQQVTLKASLREALDDGCTPQRELVMQTRIALLDAGIRRN